jgi:hypothetical protein
MCADIIAYLRGESDSLPVGPKDAIEAGLVAMAIDESRIKGKIIDMTETWKELDSLY